MKKLVICFGLLMYFSSVGQDKGFQITQKGVVGKIPNQILMYFVIEGEGKKDTLYVLNFLSEIKNGSTRYQEYQKLSYSNKDGLNEKFYSTIKSVFSEANKGREIYDTSIQLEKVKVRISLDRFFGNAKIWCSLGTFHLSEHGADKLFGKIKD